MTTVSLVRSSPHLQFQSVSRSHAGTHRTVNEDRVLDSAASGLWVVADGMGGHSDGERAAARLIAALEDVEHGPSGYRFLEDIATAVADVNAELFAERARHGGISGATVVVLLAHQHHYACLWAGDSSAYCLREGALSKITHDHSLVQQLIDGGALDEAARHHHPSGNVVTRAVGADAQLVLERRFAPIDSGDLFLLCSDGLTSCLEGGEIAEIVAGSDLIASADDLLATALARGADDNVSFVLIRAISN